MICYRFSAGKTRGLSLSRSGSAAGVARSISAINCGAGIGL